MKREVIVLLLLGVLLVSPLVLAQEQAQTYSGFDRFIDNVKVFFSSEKGQLRLSLEIREKEVDSAIINTKSGEGEEAKANLERARERLQYVQEKVSLDTVDEIKISVDEIIGQINEEENLPEEFEGYILEEEKTKLTAELTEKTLEYCKELAREDYALMLKEEECNPSTAPDWLQEELKELKKLQEELFIKLMFDIRSCIDDPGTCNCEDVADISEKAKCEKMISLAVKCEYKDDHEACNQLVSLRPPAESFVPDFLIDLFREKEWMIDYDIEKSDVPEECYNENTKPECEQYRHLKEISAKCWDAEGNWDEEECGGPGDKGGKGPTIEESIPQCYDENNNFLEEKCGKITMVKNEDGLINYLIGNEIDNVIEEFENKSEQHRTYAQGTTAVNESGLTIDSGGGQMQIQTKAREIKKDMNQIQSQIKQRTYAPGTGPGGDAGVVVDRDGPEVITDDGGDNVVAGNGGGGYAPGTTAGGDNGNVIDPGIVDGDSGGSNVVVTDDVTVDSGTIDSDGGDGGGGDDVAGVDEGPGEPGVVDED